MIKAKRNSHHKGHYIVIEGSDGTGKSSQAQLLKQYLIAQGYNVLLVEEPGGTEMAEQIRLLLKDKALVRHPRTNLALFTGARVDLWYQKIKPALAADQVVIASRNYYSSLVYQGYGEGLSLEEIKNVTSAMILDERYLQPDLVIVFTLSDQQERFSRIKQRDSQNQTDYFESKTDDFQQRIDQGYERLAQDLNLTQIPALGTPNEVFAHLRQVVDKFLDN